MTGRGPGGRRAWGIAAAAAAAGALAVARASGAPGAGDEAWEAGRRADLMRRFAEENPRGGVGAGGMVVTLRGLGGAACAELADEMRRNVATPSRPEPVAVNGEAAPSRWTCRAEGNEVSALVGD